VIELVARVVVAYLLGSISGSLIVGRLRGVDIRTQGSGNAGGTNALRTQGWRFALGVVFIDVGKGVLAAWLGGYALSEPLALRMAMLCGFAAVLGHVWPLFHGFRGGKGVATVLGALLLLWPMLLLPLLGVFAVVLVTTGYVGLGSILAGWSMLPAVWLLGGDAARDEWLVAAVVVGLFLLFTHRVNVQRLRAGTEHRFERVRLFARRR
jgi:acyl phosphate:glycerol-3-phosphate acyltransferase